MAASAVLPAMNGERTLHTFFKRNGSLDGDESAPSNELYSERGLSQLDGVAEEANHANGKEYIKKPQASTRARSQRTLQDMLKPNPVQVNSPSLGPEIPNSDSSDLLFSSSPRRKRRRTSLTECGELPGENDVHEEGSKPNADSPRQRHSSPQVVVPASSPLPSNYGEQNSATTKTPPKKMLRLNASGKFSSPASKRDKDEEQLVEAPKRRGRPRKSKEVQVDKHLVVVIRYDTTKPAIGSTIDRILSAEERYSSEVKTTTPKKQRTPRKQRPTKPTHPFFLGKPKEQESHPPKHESPRKTSAVTPGKLRRQAIASRSPMKQASRPTQDYDIGSGLLKDRLMFKHPGAKHPTVPNKELTHVRGLEATEISELDSLASTELTRGKRKRKAASLPFPTDESILKQFSECTQAEQEGELRTDEFREPHPSLELPQKLLIPGQEIAQHVARETNVKFADAEEDELNRSAPLQTAVIHPALQRIYDRLPNTTSAFDDGRGETFGWMQKYEPTTTSEVLQPSRNMRVLKDWLTSLTVTAVENAFQEDAKPARKTEPKLKRRRRKHNDLDDFLVDDDEVMHDMDELTDPEDTIPVLSNSRKATNTVVQVVSDGVKLSNTVLLSGPHGCGKTAAAYAVAKELGFKVFEISSSERRSGKDIVDKVGDMTENHLVRHHGTDTGETSAAEEPTRLDEAFQRDLASGKQGKMNAFFKPKTKSKQSSPKKKVAQKKVLGAVHKAIKKPPKDQQQSLILLEEVDILFKDDKDFWNTVFKLIESSKRPFIMTCNDEDLVPLQAMSLHAILRFSSPQVDLATDYLLLIAASEGHLLRHDTVASLYESKNQDLRASIAELDFWCQMGVGDPRGGLSWLYQRYPPGSDLDANGRKLRVVSKGTYVSGMSLATDDRLNIEVQLLWARHEHGVDPLETLGWHNDEWKRDLTLAQLSSLCGALSDTDLFSGGTNATRLDASQPLVADKARSQYIEGLTLLQTDELIDYSNLTQQIHTASILTAFKSVTELPSSSLQHSLKRTIEARHRNHEKGSPLTRTDFACFDAISLPPESALSSHTGLSQSALDGPLTPIATDIAPYVRSIVQHDLALAEQRERINGLLSEGRTAKRARTTRAARSAIEGSQRASTRRERWFSKDLDMQAVLATAGKDWPTTTTLNVMTDEGASATGSAETPASSAETPGE